MRSSEKFGKAQPYPAGRSFAELLRWHLEVWGTRPTGSTSKRGKPWKMVEFGDAVQSPATSEHAHRNVSYWLAGKRPNDLASIERELFGSALDYEDWRDELREAYRRIKRSRTIKNPLPSQISLSDPGYISLISKIEIDITCASGKIAYFRKHTTGRVTAEFLHEISDQISASGSSEFCNSEFCELKSTELAMGNLKLHTFMLRSVQMMDQEFDYKVEHRLIDTFCNQEEFWESDQITDTNILEFRIIFPNERVYSSYSATIRSSWKSIIANVQPREILVHGRPCLEWITENTIRGTFYRINWRW